MRYLEASRGVPRSAPDWRFARDDRDGKRKSRIEISIRAFKLLPRRCRLGGSPVPFGNGRTTVARASDFQLRHAMFPRRDQASLLMKYRFGNLTCISNNAG